VRGVPAGTRRALIPTSGPWAGDTLWVSIPPPVTAADAAAAIEAITARRARIDDPNAWRLTDDLLETLTYLRTYSAVIPAWVAEADVLDGLTLRVRLWWLGEEAELWLLERARRLGVPPRAVGTKIGVSSRQGVHDRLRLAREKVAQLTGQPHPALEHGHDERTRDVEATWLTQHRGEILAVASAALQFQELADDDAAEWLVDVARDLRDKMVTPGSLQTLRFALADLSTSDEVLGLDQQHPLLRTLARWAQLYGTRPE